ncbi:dihydropteroate synthase [Ketobacter sp. MCCC 1A13808]|uniref:dihydropteroate synthase n=1 Tax=Ketobacter sp. MCCC 1A13808 TaxID=2602738 RepID=UPI0012EC3BD7|nr:dihydropteroate synthase [Ketobacter sp. MCCC 1A13808]MVF12998.1 dihydropteroate synthase [Ketobacter sp. MCCC 1A13808]
MSVSDQLQCGLRSLDLRHPHVMGVLNVTPDSFSDGGLFNSRDSAIAHAVKMVAEGASIIDVGGESTRPGAAPVSEQEELDRVLPVVEALAKEVDAVISLDTSSPQVITEASRAGAGLINDVRALSRPGALSAAKDSGLPVCLMHMQGQPQSMQVAPKYDSVVAEVCCYLVDRVSVCERGGIERDRIIIDPGFGFGKSVQHNLLLLKHLAQLGQLGLPILVGLSRKSLIGTLLGRPVEERLFGSLAAALIAVQNGARIVRVHDVAATVDVLKIASAVAEVDAD